MSVLIAYSWEVFCDSFANHAVAFVAKCLVSVVTWGRFSGFTKGLGVRGRKARVDVVTMSESESLDSDSSSVLLRLCVSLGSVVGVSAGDLSSGSKSELSCSSN